MEKGYDLNKGARRLEEVRFSKIRMIMDRVADMRGQGMDVLALSAGF